MLEIASLAWSLFGADLGALPSSCPPEDKFPPRTLMVAAAPGVALIDLCSNGKLSSSRPLVTGQFKAILHDPWLDLLWVQTEKAISVMDLRKVGDGLTQIAANVPYEATFSVWSNGQRLRPQVDEPGDPDYRPYVLAFDVSRGELKIEDSSGSGPDDDFKFTGKDAFGKWKGRARNTVPEVAALNAKARIVRNYPTGPCRPAADCGTWAPFGVHADLKLVKIMSFEDEDGRRQTGCWLYDAGQRMWSSPVNEVGHPPSKKLPRGSTTCGPYWFDQSRDAYALDNRVCPAVGVCSFTPGAVIGWLHPGYWVLDRALP